MIWRRISSIDGVDEVSAGSWGPSTSQWTFGLGMRGFDLCERFVPQGEYITFLQSTKFDPTPAPPGQPFDDRFLRGEARSVGPLVTNRSSVKTARSRSVTFCRYSSDSRPT